MENYINGKGKKVLFVGLLFLGWFIGNIDRLSMNYAIISITKDFSLSPSESGLVLSAFFAGYALMQIPGGFLADKFGSKKVLLTILAIWSIFTGLTGIGWSLLAMLVIRFIFGLAEGGFFPSGAKLIAESFPTKERGRVLSIMLSSGAIAGIFVPIISTSMMNSIGWRAMFYIIGVIGLFVAVLYALFLKPPQKVTTEGDSEQNGTAQSSERKQTGSLKELIKQPLIWLVFIAYFGAYTINWGTAAWLPTYLVTVRKLDLTTLGWVSMLPYVAALVGMFASGFAFDKLAKGLDKKLAVAAMVLVSGLLVLMFTTASLTAYIIYSIFLMIGMSFVGIVLPGIPLKYLPEAVVGKASGFINTGGQLAGFLTPLIIGLIVDASGGSFTGAFLYMVALGIVCALSIVFIRYDKKPSVDATSNVIV